MHFYSRLNQELLGTFVETNGSQTGSSASNSTATETQAHTVDATDVERQGKKNDSHVEAEIKLPRSMENSTLDSRSAEPIKEENATNSRRRLLEDGASKGSEVSGSDSKANDNRDVHEATVENDQGLEADADSSFELFRDSEELADEYNYDYDDYVDESMWGDEEWKEEQHEIMENFVNVDAHILCTPVSVWKMELSIKDA